MASSYEKKGGRGKKAIPKSNKAKAARVSPKKLSFGASRPFTPIFGQDPPIIIKPGSLEIVVGSDPATRPPNRLLSPTDEEYRHNHPSYEVRAVSIYDVDWKTETPVNLPDNWQIWIYYRP